MNSNNKDLRKYTLKIVITTVISTLLFIATLLLFVLFGLKNCSGGRCESSNQSSLVMKYDYDVVKLDNKFKAIVKSYREDVNGFSSDTLSEVKAVTYVDDYDNGKFSLSISVTNTTDRLYLYKLENCSYPTNNDNFNNLIEYLLLDDTPNIFLDGDTSIGECTLLNETINTNKECKYVISGNGSNKHLDGFYFDSNQYYVYFHQQLNSNPFDSNPTQTVGLDNLLYKYYFNISIV